MSQAREKEAEALREPIKKRFGGTLAKRSPFERLAMLQRNADALVKDWRGKNDGTHIRKIFGSSAIKQKYASRVASNRFSQERLEN